MRRPLGLSKITYLDNPNFPNQGLSALGVKDFLSQAAIAKGLHLQDLCMHSLRIFWAVLLELLGSMRMLQVLQLATLVLEIGVGRGETVAE